MNNYETQKKKKTSASMPLLLSYIYLFTQKCYRDRPIKKVCQEDVVTFVESVTEIMETTYENENNNNEEIMNASFLSKNGAVIDLNTSVIDKDTPIYQVLDSDLLPKETSLQENLNLPPLI